MTEKELLEIMAGKDLVRRLKYTNHHGTSYVFMDDFMDIDVRVSDDWKNVGFYAIVRLPIDSEDLASAVGNNIKGLDVSIDTVFSTMAIKCYPRKVNDIEREINLFLDGIYDIIDFVKAYDKKHNLGTLDMFMTLEGLEEFSQVNSLAESLMKE